MAEDRGSPVWKPCHVNPELPNENSKLCNGNPELCHENPEADYGKPKLCNVNLEFCQDNREVYDGTPELCNGNPELCHGNCKLTPCHRPFHPKWSRDLFWRRFKK